VASALGTVGLSTGTTAHLTAAGRFIVIFLMFLGRLGPIAVFAALSAGAVEEKIEHPGEAPLIG
jgi:trk system potassium uptake protein TrkH